MILAFKIFKHADVLTIQNNDMFCSALIMQFSGSVETRLFGFLSTNSHSVYTPSTLQILIFQPFYGFFNLLYFRGLKGIFSGFTFMLLGQRSLNSFLLSCVSPYFFSQDFILLG